eukprot:8875540-Ditylum_brightwellii.AAC.1
MAMTWVYGPHTKLLILHEAYIAKADDHLYVKSANSHYVQHISVAETLATYTQTNIQLQVPPPDTVFTPIHCICERIICSNLIDMLLHDAKENSLDTASFSNYLSDLDPYMKHLLANLVTQNIDTNYWIQVLKEENVVLASDVFMKN